MKLNKVKAKREKKLLKQVRGKSRDQIKEMLKRAHEEAHRHLKKRSSTKQPS